MSRVFIEMEKLSNLNSGLGQFNLHLGQALVKQNKQHELQFYVPSDRQGIFGSQSYIFHKSSHKFFSPVPANADVWHGTHQQTKYWPSNKKTRTVLTVHDLNFLFKYQGWKKKRALRKLQSRINRSDKIITISQFTANELASHISLGNKIPQVIYNGNTLQVFENVKRPKWLGNDPFLFSIGIISVKKNFHTLVAMMSKLKDIKLVIAGNNSGSYADKIREEIKAWKVEDQVMLPGEITNEERYWLYTHCEGFVFPSLAEGFGLPVIEAMSAGKPVFISRATSLPEIGGNEAYYWDDFYFQHMADVVEKGLIDARHNPGKKERLQQHAAQFTWQRSAQAYLQVYSEVTAG
jgi:glycosyltransferase involved in cell wall biosynthesis